MWTSGKINVDTNAEQSAGKTVTLEKYAAHRWQKKIVIKKSAEEIFDSESDQLLKINYGLLVHTVLSRINAAEEVAPAITAMRHEGLIAETDVTRISDALHTLFTLPQVQDWFSDRWQAKTEAPILLPDGKEARIDRLLIADKKAIVIDFKTGAPNKKDEQQVKDYLNIMREMNFTDVEGFLLYLRDNTITEIKLEGRQKLVKKSVSKDQLSLGF
jgi:CRISPR/Cas system-associated exonuclease Cas4 (RecB family)